MDMTLIVVTIAGPEQTRQVVQADLFGLLPGARGGRALRDQQSTDYFIRLGARGGRTTCDRYGCSYMRELARRGGQAKRDKAHRLPRTARNWDGTLERLVPWWPHQPTRQRRKRPVMVRIEIEEQL